MMTQLCVLGRLGLPSCPAAGAAVKDAHGRASLLCKKRGGRALHLRAMAPAGQPAPGSPGRRLTQEQQLVRCNTVDKVRLLPAAAAADPSLLLVRWKFLNLHWLRVGAFRCAGKRRSERSSKLSHRAGNHTGHAPRSAGARRIGAFVSSTFDQYHVQIADFRLVSNERRPAAFPATTV